MIPILSRIINNSPQSRPQYTTTIILIIGDSSQCITSRGPSVGMLGIPQKYYSSLQINGS